MHNNEITKRRQSLMVLRVDDPETAFQSKAGTRCRSKWTEIIINFTWLSIFYFKLHDKKYYIWKTDSSKNTWFFLCVFLSEISIIMQDSPWTIHRLFSHLFCQGAHGGLPEQSECTGKASCKYIIIPMFAKIGKAIGEGVPCIVGEMGSDPIYR